MRRALLQALSLAAFSLAACAQVLGDDFHLGTGGSSGASSGTSSSSGSGGSDGGPQAKCPAATIACQTFCATIRSGGTSCVASQYGDEAGCEAVCTLAYTDATNLACRTTLAPTVGCTVAGPSSVSPTNDSECGNTLCQQFCLLQGSICGFGNGSPYATQADCLSDCANHPLGIPYDATSAPEHGATIACGISQLVLAACDPARYCPETRPATPGPCEAPACVSCLEAAVQGSTTGLMASNVCSGSEQAAYTGLLACACVDCESDCSMACGGTPATTACIDCVMMTCQAAYMKCMSP